MNTVSGKLYWTDINDVPKKYPYLSRDLDTEVAIIGGGISGALCGYAMSTEGIPCVLLEANIAGYGATSASTSILQYEVDYDLTELSSKTGEKKAVLSFRLCESAVHDIKRITDKLGDSCGFQYRDCLYYSPSKSSQRKMHHEYKKRLDTGFNVEHIDAESAQGMFSFRLETGIYSRGASAQIDPYRFTCALLERSEKNGLSVFENTEVTGIENTGGAVYVKTNKHCTVTARKVIIATGFEALKYINEHIANLTRTFTIVTEPVKSFKGWHNACIIRDDNDPYTYLRTTGDNRIIIGGEDLPVGGERSKLYTGRDIDNVSNEKYTLLENRLKQMFPEIEAKAEYRFSGLFATTKDGLPYVGEYAPMPGCWFCLGFGSNGILYSLLGAQILLELYLGRNQEALSIFRFGR